MSGNTAPAFDPMAILSQGAQGNYVAPPSAALGNMPADPGATHTTAPTNPGSQDAPDPAQPAWDGQPGVVPRPPSPAPVSFDPMAILGAGAKGQFHYDAPAAPSAQPVTPSSPDAGPLAQIGSGLAQGMVGLPNTLANLPIKGINALFGSKIPEFSTNPFPVRATSEGNRMLQGAGSAIGSLLPMVGGGEALAALAPEGSVTAGVGNTLASVQARAVPSVAVGGAAGQAASDAAPQPYKGLANLAGNIAGGGATALAQEGAVGAVKGAGSAANNLGLTPNKSFSEGLPSGSVPIRATSGEAAQAVAKVQKAGGADLGSRLAQTNPLQDAHDALEDKVNAGTATPDEINQLSGLKTALAARGQVIGPKGTTVPNQFENAPGDRPTLLQSNPVGTSQEQMGNLAGLDKTAKLRRPAAFQTQASARNAAQVQAISGTAPPPDTSLGDWFVKQATAAQQKADATAAAGAQKVQGVTEGLGTGASPDVTGQAMRSTLEAEHTAAKQNVSDQFWSQVPESLTHPIQATKALANVFLGNARVNLPADAPPEMQALAQTVQKFAPDPTYSLHDLHPIEQNALNKVAALPDQIPYRGTARLLSGIAQDKASLANQGLAQSDTMARLSMIEQSLKESMSGDAQQRITDGQMFTPSPETAEGGAALSAARKASAGVAQTYQNGPVGDILSREGYGQYSVPDLSAVTKRIVTGGENEPQHVGSFLAANNGNPQGLQALHDAYVYDAQKRGVIQPDGTVDAKAFGRWMTPARARALDQVPELRDRLNTANGLQTTVDTTNGEATAAVKNFNRGAASKFISGTGADMEPTDAGIAVRDIMNKNDGGQSFDKLVQQIQKSGDKSALQGLQSHVVEQMRSKFAAEYKASAGQEAAAIPNQAFRKFLSDNAKPLKRLFGGQGVQNFDQVRAGLQNAQRAAEAIPGSQTTPLSILARMGNVGHGAAGAAGGGMGIGIAAMLGEHGMEAMGGAGMIGALGAPMLMRLGSSIRGANIDGIDSLTDAMLEHPAFARAMTQRFPPGTTTIPRQAAANIAASLRAITASRLGDPRTYSQN